MLGLMALLWAGQASAQIHFSENFNGNTLPAGWNNTNLGTGACQWMIHAPFTYQGEAITMVGSNYLFVNSDSAGSATVANETITSPVVNVPSGVPVFLSLSHFFKAGGSLRRDTGFVEVYDGNNWITLQKVFTTTGTGIEPVVLKVNLQNYVNPALRFRFRYKGNWAYFWAIDNVVVSTPAPNDLGVIAIPGSGNACGIPASFAPRIRITNFGSAAQTGFPVSYRVNGLPPVTETFSGNIVAGDTVVYTFTTPFAAPSPGTYSFSAWTGLSNDAITSNDSVSGVNFVRSAAGFSTRNFSGYTGGNLTTLYPGWQEQTGNNPSPGASAWESSTTSQTSFLGTTTAKINLYFNTERAWLTTPGFNPVSGSALRFKLAVTENNGNAVDSMGNDDSLVVRISTNCGQSWTRLQAFTKASGLTNQLTSQSVSLDAFAGQTVRIGFFATEGTVNNTEDYDLHLTDIQLGVPSPNDIAITDVTVPSGPCGVGPGFQLSVKLFNNGTQTQTSIPVSYKAGNLATVSQTFSVNLAAGDQTTVVFTNPVVLPAPGSYPLQVWATLPGDANIDNDSLNGKTLTRSPISFPAQSFTGFNGDNISTLFPGWSEFSGLTPTGTTSTWLNSNATQQTFFGTTTARVNLYTNNRREWLVTPPIEVAAGYVFRFKAALTTWNNTTTDSMGTDDSLVVKISTNCGQTWTRVKWFTQADQLSNQLTNQLVPLDAYVGQIIRIAMYGTDGNIDNNPDYDIHVDDMEVSIPSPTDAAVSQVLVPNQNCGVPASLVVQVRITNNGSLTLTSLPLSYRIGSQAPVQQTFPANLSAGQSATFSFSTPAQFPTAGNYTLSVWSQVPGDLNTGNDSLMGIAITRLPANFPVNTFTGFTGTNLNTVFPGWNEATGAFSPSIGFSSWANSSNAQTNALGSVTAKVNLFENTKRDWLMSPAFNPETGMVLRFKLAITNANTAAIDSMGSDDSLKIMVSTNCGSSWTMVRSFNRFSGLSNTLSTQLVPLSAFSGQTIQVGFLATDGLINNLNDYDLHIDDVSVIIPPAADLGVTQLTIPAGGCGVPSSFQLAVEVTNFGAQAQSGFQIGYQLNGAAAVLQTYASTLNPGQSANVVFTTPLSLSSGTSYLLRSWSQLAGDAQVQNDSSEASFTTPGSSLPAVGFVAFDGTNLEELFPGWEERSGPSPITAGSSWFASNASQANTLGSPAARIGMSSNVKRDWILGPVFQATGNSVLRFKLAVTERNFSIADAMGSDDSLNVMASTDCGLTWFRIQAFTSTSGLTNQLVEKTVDLSPFSGQLLKIGFKATEGNIDNTNDFDLHLDDISIGINTSVTETGAHGWELYPNPVRDFLFVKLPKSQIVLDAQVMSVDGKSWNLPFDAVQGSIPVSSLPSGMHLLRIRTDREVRSFRFLVP